MTVTVKYHGPLFDGTADAVVDDILQGSEEAIAREGMELIQQELKGSLKHPTGRYQSSIHLSRSSTDVEILDGTLYGPWLEGVGSRNARSRFKGYAAFRKSAQKLQQRADEIAEKIVSQNIGRLN